VSNSRISQQIRGILLIVLSYLR